MSRREGGGGGSRQGGIASLGSEGWAMPLLSELSNGPTVVLLALLLPVVHATQSAPMSTADAISASLLSALLLTAAVAVLVGEISRRMRSERSTPETASTQNSPTAGQYERFESNVADGRNHELRPHLLHKQLILAPGSAAFASVEELTRAAVGALNRRLLVEASVLCLAEYAAAVILVVAGVPLGWQLAHLGAFSLRCAAVIVSGVRVESLRCSVLIVAANLYTLPLLIHTVVGAARSSFPRWTPACHIVWPMLVAQLCCWPSSSVIEVEGMLRLQWGCFRMRYNPVSTKWERAKPAQRDLFFSQLVHGGSAQEDENKDGVKPRVARYTPGTVVARNMQDTSVAFSFGGEVGCLVGPESIGKTIEIESVFTSGNFLKYRVKGAKASCKAVVLERHFDNRLALESTFKLGDTVVRNNVDGDMKFNMKGTVGVIRPGGKAVVAAVFTDVDGEVKYTLKGAVNWLPESKFVRYFERDHTEEADGSSASRSYQKMPKPDEGTVAEPLLGAELAE
eukprot:Sspe_Gene.54917::Locus_30255_Transcript_1_1_Confidence_1.000_Length_4369::g.54917::m.54917